MKLRCILYGHLDCMKESGCCRKCKHRVTCMSNLRCDNDPAKCGMYKEYNIDLRKLMRK